MTRRRVLTGVALLVVAVIAGTVAYRGRGPAAPEVAVEAVVRRDLEALVSASGKIEPKRSVNISADTMGRVTELLVNEGDRVTRG